SLLYLVALLLDFAKRCVDRAVLVEIEFEVVRLFRVMQDDFRAADPAVCRLVVRQWPLQRRLSGSEFDRQTTEARGRGIASLDLAGAGGEARSRRLRSGGRSTARAWLCGGSRRCAGAASWAQHVRAFAPSGEP